jgi:hypothetical protein
LLITGPDDSIEEFTETLNENGEFCFSQTLPRPAELNTIISGSNTIDGKRCSAWREVDGKSIPITEEEMAELKLKYSHTDWYEWSIANWGTKWDCDLTSVEVDERLVEGSYLSCNFDTAWSPPVAWAKNVSRKYPLLSFNLYFSEGGVGFYGHTTIIGGNVFLENVSENFWKKAIDNEAEPDDNLTASCRAFLRKHKLHTGG